MSDDQEEEMSFSEWMRKRWYVLLISAGLGSALASVVGDLYFYPLGRHSVIVGVLLAYGATYIIYKAEHPGDE
jgi:hypothetical protein